MTSGKRRAVAHNRQYALPGTAWPDRTKRLGCCRQGHRGEEAKPASHGASRCGIDGAGPTPRSHQRPPQRTGGVGWLVCDGLGSSPTIDRRLSSERERSRLSTEPSEVRYTTSNVSLPCQEVAITVTEDPTTSPSTLLSGFKSSNVATDPPTSLTRGDYIGDVRRILRTTLSR
jgi:hypothetical protein